MKSHPILVGISAVLVILCSIAAIAMIWERLHTLYPTPETESAFLKSYTPQHVIEQFECNLPSSYACGHSGAAGRKFVTHTAECKSYFAMPSEKWMPLMNALSDDVSAQLLRDGAQILDLGGDPRSGFHFDYKVGKSFGKVAISPLAITSSSIVRRGALLPAGTVDATAEIQVAEKWFPKEPGIIQVRLGNSLR